MVFKMACPHCMRKLNVTEKAFGRTVPCPGCNQPIKVPYPAAIPPSASAVECSAPWVGNTQDGQTARTSPKQSPLGMPPMPTLPAGMPPVPEIGGVYVPPEVKAATRPGSPLRLGLDRKQQQLLVVGAAAGGLLLLCLLLAYTVLPILSGGSNGDAAKKVSQSSPLSPTGGGQDAGATGIETDSKLIGSWKFRVGRATFVRTYESGHLYYITQTGRAGASEVGEWKLDGDRLIQKPRSSTSAPDSVGKESVYPILRLDDSVLIIRAGDRQEPVALQRVSGNRNSMASNTGDKQEPVALQPASGKGNTAASNAARAVDNGFQELRQVTAQLHLPPALVGIIAAISIVVGVSQCFFGYRIFMVMLALTGFLIGAVLAGGIGYAQSHEAAVALLSAIVGGFIGAVLMLVLHFVGVFVVGAIFGAILGAVLCGAAHSNLEPAVLIIPAVMGGIAALLLRRFMIILATGFSGAWNIVTGIAYFTTIAIDRGNVLEVFWPGGRYLFPVVLCWLALGIFGVIVQYKIVPLSPPEPTPAGKE